MDSTLIFIVIPLATLGLLLAVVLTSTKIRKYRQQVQQKETLKKSVRRYRLSKMLAYLGIKLDDYVTRIPGAVIQRHITRCKACPDIPTCDRCLRDGEIVSNMHFCPNYRSLLRYSRMMPPTG